MAYSWITRPDGRVIVNGIELWPSDAEAARMDSDVLAPWRPLAERVSGESGVPVAWILGVTGAESFGYQYAMSRNPDGSPLAYGLMQLLPQFHFPKGTGQDYWFDPLNNMRAGAKYLKSFIDQGYDLPRAAAAYNAGHLSKDSSDWGFHADPGYISNVVSRTNYAYEHLAGGSAAGLGAASLGAMALGAVGVGLLGWYAYRQLGPRAGR
jgi:soluble lytic murein transglycosylase-like protein